MRMKLSDRISRRMAEKNVTIYQVAAAVGVTDKAVRNWMAGGHRPRDEKLPALAKALDWTVRDLLGPDG